MDGFFFFFLSWLVNQIVDMFFSAFPYNLVHSSYSGSSIFDHLE